MTPARPSLVVLAALALGACRSQPGPENEPPQVPRLPRVERLEVDRFRLDWTNATDDETPAAALLYNVGIVESDVCITRAPSYTTVGTTGIDILLPAETGEEPFVGFTVRSVDRVGDSRGYGPCAWSLRSPVALPLDIPARAPRLVLDAGREGRPDCRPDGAAGVWCLGDGEVSHLDGADWESLPVPVPFAPTAWAPLGPYAVVLHSQRVQLQLSRANGVQAFALSAGSEYFDPGSGSLPGLGGQSFLVVRGLVAELRRRHLDLMGPPMTLALPDGCPSLVQLAQQDALALALCRNADAHLLFVGELGARALWDATPLEVAADRIESAIGTRARGLAALSGPTGAWLASWDGDRSATRAMEGLPGLARPAVAVAGTLDSPLVMAAEGDRWLQQVGSDLVPLPVEGGLVRLGDVLLPAASALVGCGETGIHAISPAATARITALGVPLLIEYGHDVWGARGGDHRHYLVRGPHFDSVLSSSGGDDWFVHPWRGTTLEPVSLAVTPSGGIYVSGWRPDPNAPQGHTPMVARLGEEDVDLAPHAALALEEPPRLAADDLGRLYAAIGAGVTWRDPANGTWAAATPLPGPVVTQVLGLAQGVLVVSEGAPDGTQVLACVEGHCAEVPLPEEDRHLTPGQLVRHGGGFCAALHGGHRLWCRDGDRDSHVPITFSPDLAGRHGLGDQDLWAVLDAVNQSDGGWLLAIRAPEGDMLAGIDAAGGTARLLALGLHWANGAVLLQSDVAGEVVVLAPEGPARLRFSGEGAALPDLLYP